MASIEDGRVLGSYKVKGLIGEGGMAEVYLAEHSTLGGKVALKVLAPRFASNPDMVKRFIREARNAFKLRNDYIVGIHGVYQEGGINYFPMDFLDGGTLEEYLRDHAPLPPDEALSFAHQIALALKAAHEQGVVHRDIKPSNVMMDKSKHVKVGDFGIAKAAEESRITQEGSILCTLQYASPEQLSGRDADKVDRRSDLYSLAVVLYEMVTGQAVFAGMDTAALMYKKLNEVPQIPKDLGRRLGKPLCNLIAKGLERRPEDRFQSADEMIAAIKAVLMGKGFKHKVSIGARLGGGRPNQRLVVGLAAGAFLVLLGVGGFIYLQPPAPSPRGGSGLGGATAGPAAPVKPAVDPKVVDEARRLWQEGENAAARNEFDRARQLWEQAQAVHPDFAAAKTSLANLGPRVKLHEERLALQKKEEVLVAERKRMEEEERHKVEVERQKRLKEEDERRRAAIELENKKRAAHAQAAQKAANLVSQANKYVESGNYSMALTLLQMAQGMAQEDQKIKDRLEEVRRMSEAGR